MLFRSAAREGLTNTSFRVMNAESLEFDDSRFDVVFGIGILHHLDLDRAYSEIARVLNPNGVAVFLEPLGHNPFINLARRMTPKSRTADEHPMLTKDLRLLSGYFSDVDISYVNFTTLALAPFGWIPGAQFLVPALRSVDRALFRVAPFSRRFAWNAVLQLRRPKSRIVKSGTGQLAEHP